MITRAKNKMIKPEDVKNKGITPPEAQHVAGDVSKLDPPSGENQVEAQVSGNDCGEGSANLES